MKKVTSFISLLLAVIIVGSLLPYQMAGAATKSEKSAPQFSTTLKNFQPAARDKWKSAYTKITVGSNPFYAFINQNGEYEYRVWGALKKNGKNAYYAVKLNNVYKNTSGTTVYSLELKDKKARDDKAADLGKLKKTMSPTEVPEGFVLIDSEKGIVQMDNIFGNTEYYIWGSYNGIDYNFYECDAAGKVAAGALPIDMTFVQSRILKEGGTPKKLAKELKDSKPKQKVFLLTGKGDLVSSPTYGYNNNGVLAGQTVKTTETVTVRDAIAYKTIYKDNKNLYVGQEEVIQAGVEGVRETQYKVTYTNGKETARKQVYCKTITKAVDQIIARGTKTQGTHYVLSDNVSISISVGSSYTEGDTVKASVSIKGKAPSGSKYSFAIAGPDGNIASSGSAFPASISGKAKTPGSYTVTAKLTANGETITARAHVTVSAKPAPSQPDQPTPTTPPQPVITEKTVTEKVAIPFTTERQGDPNMFKDEAEKVARKGIDGEKTVYYLVTYKDGVEVSREKTGETVSKEMVSKIIKYGTKDHVIETRTEDVFEDIDFTVEHIKDANRFIDDAPATVRKGVKGQKKITYQVTYKDGVAQEGTRRKIGETVVKEPVSQQIADGTKEHVYETKTEEEFSDIAFKTEKVNDSSRYVDDPEIVKREGVKGQLKTTYTVTYKDGIRQADTRKKTGETVVKEPVSKQIAVGTKEHVYETRDDGDEVVSVKFGTTYTDDPTRYVDDPEVTVSEGVKGEAIKYYVVTYKDGVRQPDTRKVARTETTKEPVDKVVSRGTKEHVYTSKEETVTETIPFKTVKKDAPDLYVGTESVFQEGENGEKSVTYTITYKDGQEESRTVKSETVIKEAINKIIRVGTKEKKPAYSYEYTEINIGISASGKNTLSGRCAAKAMSMAKAGKVSHSGGNFLESVGSFSSPGGIGSALISHVPGIATAKYYGVGCVKVTITDNETGAKTYHYYACAQGTNNDPD